MPIPLLPSREKEEGPDAVGHLKLKFLLGLRGSALVSLAPKHEENPAIGKLTSDAEYFDNTNMRNATSPLK
jgi:hypothetical protein